MVVFQFENAKIRTSTKYQKDKENFDGPSREKTCLRGLPRNKWDWNQSTQLLIPTNIDDFEYIKIGTEKY